MENQIKMGLSLEKIIELEADEKTMAVTDEDAKKMVLDMIGQDRFKKFEEEKDADFSTTISSGDRFRVNTHYQRETIAISFRVITNHIPLMKATPRAKPSTIFTTFSIITTCLVEVTSLRPAV